MGTLIKTENVLSSYSQKRLSSSYKFSTTQWISRVFFTRKWRFLTRSSGLLWHIRYTYTMYQFGVIYIKTFPVHCNSLLSFDSVMCIIMRTATCDNIHVFSSADLKAQFRFTYHCSFVVRMSAKLFLEKDIHNEGPYHLPMGIY